MLDVDADGWLDVVYPTLQRNPADPRTTISLGGPDGFAAAAPIDALTSYPVQYVQTADLDGDGVDEILVNATIGVNPVDGTSRSPVFPASVLRAGPQPSPVDAGALGLPVTNPAIDSVTADLTGDGLPDVLTVGGEPLNDLNPRPRNSEALDDPFDPLAPRTLLQARLYPGAEALGFSFRAGANWRGEEDVTFWVSPTWQIPPGDVVVGAQGNGGRAVRRGEYLELVVDPARQATWGRPAFTEGQDDGIFVWFDPATDRWTVVHSRSGAADSTIVARPRGAVLDHEVIGFDAGLVGFPTGCSRTRATASRTGRARTSRTRSGP